MKINKILRTEYLKLGNRINILFFALSVLFFLKDFFLVGLDLSLSNKSNLSANMVYNPLTHSLISSVNILTIWIIQNVGSEFSNKIVQRNIINGFTRSDYFLTKFSFLLLISCFFALCSSITILSFVKINHIEIQWHYIITRAFTVFTYATSIGSIAFFIIFVLRNSLYATICYFVYFFSEIILNRLSPDGFSRYLPITIFRKSINDNPKLVSSFFDISNTDIAIHTLLFALIITTSYFLFLKRDFSPL